jgi:hypothetical protein
VLVGQLLKTDVEGTWINLREGEEPGMVEMASAAMARISEVEFHSRTLIGVRKLLKSRNKVGRGKVGVFDFFVDFLEVFEGGVRE